jgi:hypothetical protein
MDEALSNRAVLRNRVKYMSTLRLPTEFHLRKALGIYAGRLAILASVVVLNLMLLGLVLLAKSEPYVALLAVIFSFLALRLPVAWYRRSLRVRDIEIKRLRRRVESEMNRARAAVRQQTLAPVPSIDDPSSNRVFSEGVGARPQWR